MIPGANPYGASPYENIHDHTGRYGKHRCEDPRRWSPNPPPGHFFRTTHLSRCWKCEPCRDQKKAIRTARMMREHVRAKRTWKHTVTFSPEHWLRYLADKGHGASVGFLQDGVPKTGFASPEAEQIYRLWERRLAQKLRADFHKRLRKHGAEFRACANWEKHQTGQPHSHDFIHETGKPILWIQIKAASYITPRGYPYPQRLEHEGNYQYWKRVNDQLWEDWNEWIRLRNDPSEAARLRRLELPFQCGNVYQKGTNLVKGRGALHYAAKNAAYSSKEGGRFSASPRYGKVFTDRIKTREHRVKALASLAAWWVTVMTQRPNTGTPDTATAHTAAPAAEPCQGTPSVTPSREPKYDRNAVHDARNPRHTPHAVGPGSHDPHTRGAAPAPSGADGLRPGPTRCRLAAKPQDLGSFAPRISPLGPPTTGPPK